MAQQLKFSPLVFAILLLTALIAWIYWPAEVQKSQRRGGDIPVLVAEVIEQPFASIVEALGTAAANEAIVVTAQETDKVQKLFFEDGELVKKDQLLVTMNTVEERARLSELEINLAEARRQLERVRDLAKENAASEQVLDERRAAVDALEAQISVAKAQIADREIRAPFDGLLGTRQISEGALIRPGDQITTLDDIHTLKVDFSVAERHLPSVKLNQKVQASSVAYPDRVFEGVISHIASRVDPITRAIQVRALVSNPDLELRPGMLLQMVVEKNVVNSLVIPESALVPINDEQFVYLVVDGKAQRTRVTLGERRAGEVQILDGLEPGQQVVSGGTIRLRDGIAVKVVEG